MFVEVAATSVYRTIAPSDVVVSPMAISLAAGPGACVTVPADRDDATSDAGSES